MADSHAAGSSGEQKAMPLLDHLIELRRRLVYAAIAFAVAFVLCYIVADEVYAFLIQPLADLYEGEAGRRMIYTGLHEAFFTYLKVAFFGAAFVSFPILASQIWIFTAPGLYKNERRAFLPFLLATPILFVAGAALAYYVIFPLAWSFFISFETVGGVDTLAIQLEPKVNEYLSLVMKLIFAFGLSFQLPVVMTLLARAGLITSQTLSSKRKYAIVITFVAAAFLTPPDIISQIGLGVPILILYEISILCVRMVERRRARDEAASEAS